MITTLFRTPVRPSISERWDGLRVSASRPATTARPSREPCDVRIRNRMSLSPFIFFASACNVVASVSTVALPPVLVLYFTTTGSPPNRLATICAAPVASRRKTPSSPNRPNDTTVILRGFSAACTVATVDANVRRKTMTGALSRLTKDSIVTTNLHFNNVQGHSREINRRLGNADSTAPRVITACRPLLGLPSNRPAAGKENAGVSWLIARFSRMSGPIAQARIECWLAQSVRTSPRRSAWYDIWLDASKKRLQGET